MRPSFHESPEFARLIRGESPVSLELISLEIARDAYPRLDFTSVQRRLEELADRVRSRCPAHAGTRAMLAQVRWVLHVEEGFRGNQEAYHEAANSYLNEVLARKKGIPISLCLVYLSLAERLGIPLAGVSLPAHFMLRVMDQPIPLFLDAFNEGTLLDQNACEAALTLITGVRVKLNPRQVEPCEPAEFVSRMLRNLREIYLREGDFAHALPVLRRHCALDPSNAGFQKDRGVVALEQGYPGEALGPLQMCFDEVETPEDREELARLIRIAKRQQAERN